MEYMRGSIMGKGTAAEHELSNRLEDDFGMAAMPAGGSGSGTDRPRPDVLAAYRPTGLAGLSTQTYAIECKAWSDGLGQLDGDEIANLHSFASRAGGTPLVAVRPDLRSFDRWHCYRIQDLNQTDGGNYSIRQAERPGRSLDEVVGHE